MKQYQFQVAVVLSLVVLSACAPVISSELRKEARKDLSFDQVTRNPVAYTGSVVIWGGIIISVENCPDGSFITVLQTPLDDYDQPGAIESSRGRFLVTTSQFADPIVFAKGKRITVVGAITGKATRPIENSKVMYTYPVVNIKQVVLWSVSEYPPTPHWWDGGSGCTRSDEGPSNE